MLTMKSTSSDGDGASKNAIACTHGIVNADIQTSWHYSNEQHIINTEPLGGNKKCNDEEKFAVEQLLRKAFPETMSKAGTNRHKKLFIKESRPPFQDMECLSYQSCAADGCLYEARIMRTRGIVMLYQKRSHDAASHFRSPVKQPGGRATLMKPAATKVIYDSMHARPASSVYDSLARQRLLTKRQLELPDDKQRMKSRQLSTTSERLCGVDRMIPLHQ
jgi:hypothetical protein